MRDPFSIEDFDKAFAPMFSEAVILTLKDGSS